MLRPVRLGLLLLLSLGASLSLYVLLSSSRLDSLANPARYGYPPPARNSSSSGTSAAQHSSSSDDDDEGDLSAHAMLTRVHRALKRATLRSIASHTSALAHGGNALSCPVSQLQSNKDQLRGDGARWARYSPEFLERKRAQVLGATWDTLVQQVSTAAAAANDDDEDDEKAERVEVAARFDDEQQVKKVVDEARQVGEGWMTAQRTFERGSRGIVATAGNKDTLARLVTMLTILRRTHACKLPVQVFMYDSELAAASRSGSLNKTLDRLSGKEGAAAADITFTAVKKAKQVKGAWKNFQIKGEAIARSTFDEVLYLDSDNIPLQDPSILFDAPLFKETGLVLWPDLSKDSPANAIFRLSDTRCDASEWQAESGQLLARKSAQGARVHAVLLAAEQMQLDSEFWFSLSGGDKDTFRYAAKLLGVKYGRAPRWVSLVGDRLDSTSGSGGHTFCGHTMLQYGLDAPSEWRKLAGGERRRLESATMSLPPPMFAHANLLKHSGYRNKRGNTFRVIKHAVPDSTAAPDAGASTFVRDDVRAGVYTTPRRTMCSDLWDAAASSGAREGDEAEIASGAYEQGRVACESVEQAFGGLLRDLDDVYYDAGGVAGAW